MKTSFLPLSLATAMLATTAFAGSIFSYKITLDNGSNSLLEFGRNATAVAGVDDYDLPMAPPTPILDGTTYVYFQGVASQGTAYEGQSYEYLANDFRSSNDDATTWNLVVESMKGSTLNLSWAAGTALTSGVLTLVDANGTTLADMLKKTSYTISATGTYKIVYKKSSSTSEAPATPAPIAVNIVPYEGASVTADLNPVSGLTYKNFKVLGYDADGNGTELNGTTATYANGTLTLTLDNDALAYKSLKVFYTVSNKSGSTDGEVDVEFVNSKLTLVDNDGTLNFETLDPQSVTCLYEATSNTSYAVTHNLDSNWTVAIDPANVAGITTEFTVTLTPSENASNTTLTITAGEATATVNLTGFANLDIDGDEVLSPDDVILINNFVALYDILGDDITPEDVVADLDKDNGEEILAALKAMYNSNTLDIDEDSVISPDDVILINNFISLYDILGDDITPEDVVGDLDKDNGEQILENLKKLL